MCTCNVHVHVFVQVFRIRELAMCTIGRLSNLNPAYVMPTLRKVLIQVSMLHNVNVICYMYIHVYVNGDNSHCRRI